MSKHWIRSLFSRNAHTITNPQRRPASLRLEPLGDRIVPTQLQYGLFDTGVDANGDALTGGAADTHYTLPVTQQGTAGMNAVVVSNVPVGWAANDLTHAAIAPSADPSSAPPGTYEYETTFTAGTAGNAKLSGGISADNDVVDILINGVSTGFSHTNAVSAFTSFNLSAAIVAGTNTLDFVVSNGGSSGNPTGVHLKDLAVNYLPTVAVDHAALNVTNGGAASNTGTFYDLDAGDTVTITSSRGSVSQSGTNSGTFTYFEPNVTTGGTVTITATDSNGGVSTTTFTISVVANQPPTITAGGSTPTAQGGGAGVVVDAGVSVVDPDGPNLTTASVAIGTNFVAAQDRLLFTNQNGITGSYNTSTGILTLSGSATAADYQTALRSVRYQNISGGASTAPRSINFSIAPGTYNPVSGHFYEFVANQGITWTAAKAAADARTIFGLQGYLTTLTSQAENDFAFSKTQAVGWIGASDAAVEGEWRWADGPEAGQQFWQGLAPASGGSAVGGRYNNWSSGEPNNAGNEDYAHFLGTGKWNDYANTTPVQGYVVEYGGTAGDPVLQVTSQATVNVVNATSAPTVTSPAGPQVVNAATALVQGTAAADSLVQVYADSNNNGVIDAGDTVVASQQLTGGATAYAVTVPLTQDAVNHFLVTATASPATESTPVGVPAITEDSTAPTTPTVATPAAPQTVNAPSVVVGGTAEAASLVKVYRDANNNGVIDAGDTVVASQQLAAGQGTYSITTPLTQDAMNNFLVSASDAAGNESVGALVPTVTEDSTPPTAPTVTTPAVSFTTNANAVTVSGTAEAGSLVKVYRDTNNNGTVDAGDTVVASQQLTTGQTAYGVSAPLTANAANHFLVVATDAAGNASTAATVPTVTQDSIAPVAPTVTTPAAPFSVNAATTSVAGSAEAGGLVEVYVDTNNNGVIDAGDTLAGSQQLAPGATAYAVTVPLTQDAANHFLVTVTDAGGNGSPAAVVPTVTEDSTPPVAPTVTAPAAQTVNANTVAVTGGAEAGSLVTVYRDTNGNGVIDAGDVAVGARQLAAGVTAYSITVPLTQDAVNKFLVSTTDAAGNTSPAAVVPTVIEDSTPPVAPTVTTPATAVSVNANTAAVTGTAEAGSLVKVYRDANNNGTVDAGDTVVASQQLSAGLTGYAVVAPLTQDAVNHFIVVASDAAGNVSPAGIVPAVTEDSIAPSAPTVVTPAAPQTINANTAAVTGTAEAGSLVTVYADTNNDGVVDAGDTLVASQQLSAGLTGYAVVVPLAQDAVNNFLVVSTDAAGNASAPTVVPAITEDSTAPVAPTVTAPSAQTVNAATIGVAGSAEAGSLVTVYADTNNDGVVDAGDTLVASQQLSAGLTGYAVVVPLDQDAVNNFLVVSTDAAGNTSAAGVVPAVTEDSTPPVAPTVATPAGPRTTNATSVDVTGTAEAGGLVEVYADTNGNGVIDAGDTVAGSQQLAPGQTAYSINVPLTSDTANRFLVAVTDAGGNQSVAAAVAMVTQDSISPNAPAVTTPVAPLSVNTGTFTIAGTAEAGGLVTVYRDTNGNGVVDAGEAVAGMQQLAPTGTAYSITVPLITGTANRFIVVVTDAGGNTSASTAVPTVTQDSVAPAAPGMTGISADTGSSSTDGVTSDAAPILRGTAEAASTVTISRDGVVVGTATADASGRWTFPGQTLADGVHTFTATATDAAGNVSPVGSPFAIVVDTSSPAAPGVAGISADTGSSSTDGVTSDAAPTLRGTAEAGSTVTISRDGVIVGTATADASGRWTFATTGALTSGTYQFSATATDVAGNASPASAAFVVVIDTATPDAPTVGTPGSAGTVNATTTTITGTAEAGSRIDVYADTNGNGVIDDGDTIVGTQQLADGETAYSITVPLTANAANRFLVAATDAGGNRSAVTAVGAITQDSTVPNGPTVSGPAAPQLTRGGTITLTGTAEAGGLVTVFADTNGNGVIDDGDTAVGSQQLGADQTAYSITVPLTPNGVNRFLVAVTDAGGNRSSVAVVPAVTQDSTAPVGPTVVTPAASVESKDGSYTLTGTAEAGGLIEVYADANGNGVRDAGEAVVGTQQLAAGQTAYSITVPLAVNATNRFLVAVTDAAGNASTVTAAPGVVQVPSSAGIPRAFAVGSTTSGQPAQLYNPDGTVRLSVTPFADATGGARVAAADLTGDGVADLVVGTGPGQASQVKVFDGVTGALVFQAAPFESTFTGGVFVEAADLNGDGVAELVISPDVGGGPRVVVMDGKTGAVLANFYGIDDPAFRGGVRVGAADLNNDGVPDLLVAAGLGGGPRVAGFDGKALMAGQVTRLFNDIFVFEQTLRNGVYVTAGDLNGDGFADLIVGGGPGGGPRVFALDGKALMAGQQVVLANFFAGDADSRNGIRVAAADLDVDGRTDLIVGSADDAGTQVKVYLGKDIQADGTPTATDAFDAFEDQFAPGLSGGGVFVG